jgi:hypothetical protein
MTVTRREVFEAFRPYLKPPGFTAELLKIACPENSLEQLAQWVAPIRTACRRFAFCRLPTTGSSRLSF